MGDTLILKIGDFGLARSFNSENSPSNQRSKSAMSGGSSHGSEIVGTPGYLAPEGSRHSSDKSDVYTASLILLELLCPRLLTAMERNQLLDDFKCDGKLPAHLASGGALG